VTSDQWYVVKSFIRWEIEMSNAYLEVLGALEQFMADVETFDGPNLQRFRDLTLTAAAYRLFPPGLEWMRHPERWAP